MHTFLPISFILLSFLTDKNTARESSWKFNFNEKTAGKDGAVVDMTSYMFAESFVTINVACQSASLGGPGAKEEGGQVIELSWMLVELDCEQNINSFSSQAVKKILDEPSACQIITTTPPSTSNPTPASTEFIPITTPQPTPGPPSRNKRHEDKDVDNGDNNDDADGANNDNVNNDSNSKGGSNEAEISHSGGTSENSIKDDKQKDTVDVAIETYVQFSYGQKLSCMTNKDSVVVIRLQDETKFPYHRITSLKNGSECTLAKLDRPALTSNHTLPNQVARAWSDGRYRLFVQIKTTNDKQYVAAVVVEMRDYANFLSAREWPMLPVTGLLAVFYLVIATFWIFYWARSQEHTKRIHIIIGVVAVAGAMGSTLSFADYSVRNSDGLGVPGIRWIGALLSTVQDSLTYLLLMVVSTGYGINRPKISLEWMAGMLGLSVMNFLAGVAYLIAFDETIREKYDIIPAAFKLIAAVYAIINILITGWIMIFSIYTLVYLIQRRHSSARKLQLFTVFMIACVVVFTVQFITSSYEISQGLFTACRKDWKQEWVGTSLSQLEVFILLTVLMWLWRPSDENKSYAFRPVSTNDSIQLEDDSADEAAEKILLNEF